MAGPVAAGKASDAHASIRVRNVVPEGDCGVAKFRIVNKSYPEDDFGAEVRVYFRRSNHLKIAFFHYATGTVRVQFCGSEDRVGKYRVIMYYGERLTRNDGILRTRFRFKPGA
jgi:hypothetical protein